MKLNDFPRPARNTGWGMHDSSSTGSFPYSWDENTRKLLAMGCSWKKVLADGANKVKWVEHMSAHGLGIIVRTYAHKPHPASTPAADVVRQYVEAGAHYFEFGNEPNIGEDEWSDWPGNAHLGEKLAQQWLRGANEVKRAGGIPLFFAMTPGGRVNHRETWRQVIEALDKRNALDSLKGAGVAVHVRPLNNPLDTPREDGNAVSKDGVPIFVDANGEFLRYANTTTHEEYTWFIDFFREHLGYCPPLFGTEAGYSIGDHQNDQYFAITRETHADWNHELATRFHPSHPKCWPAELVCEAYWLGREGGTWRGDEVERTELYARLLANPPRDGRNALYKGGPTPPDPQPPAGDAAAAARNAAWTSAGVAYNPEAAFQRAARARGWAAPLTGEFDFAVDGVRYRGQGFAGGIVYAKVGEWGDIREVAW